MPINGIGKSRGQGLFDAFGCRGVPVVLLPPESLRRLHVSLRFGGGLDGEAIGIPADTRDVGEQIRCCGVLMDGA
jgi:hypothetical protein